MSRAQTLVLALLALHLLLGGLCLVIARGEHKSPALKWWGWGLLLYAGGLATTLLGLAVPREAALIAGNGLITLSPVLCAHGVLLHTHTRLWRGWVAAGVLATVALLAFANLTGWQRVMTNMAAPTAMACIVFLVAAAAVARYAPKEARAAGRFLAAILALAVATWIARIAAMAALLEGTQDVERIDLVVSLFAIAQMINGVAATLSLVWIDVRLMQAELARVANTDALTGLPNRRELRRRFHEEASRAARHGQRFAIALFDVDHFKQVNDRYGHAMGDTVLQGVGAAFSAAKRGEDLLGRIGGEEFLVLLSQQSREGAKEAADRLRSALGRAELPCGGDRLRMTASAGVALYPDDGAEWDMLYAVADRRLYAAKRGGRNQVVADG